ncbi:unnamed protein product [Arctia plantaginis]|uniref:dolichyl-phosphate-mannose--protein mannosyltransferase n=1 Tax=Arctia plantaginis TaxID=874455 RepID=A0A8S1ARM5_ARCPL|nr:unnamed protein product [Arctia plantaginis]
MKNKLSVIVCLSSLPFLFTLNGDFVFDDSEAIVKNKDITSEYWTDVFNNDFWGANVKSNLSHKSYRPLTILSFRLNYLLNKSSLSALHFKITNLVCHVICCILLWKVFEHMVNVTLSAISMLCKENGITVLGLCVVYEIVVNLKPKGRDLTKSKGFNYVQVRVGADSIFRIIFITLSAMGLLYLRWIVMGGIKPEFKPTDNPTAFAENSFTKVATYSYIYFLNVLLFIWPKWLCYDWSMGCVQLIKKIADVRMLPVVLMYIYGILLLKAIFYSRNRKSNRTIILAVSLGVIPFLPASNILYPVGFVIAERILYISSAGYCLLIVMGFSKLLHRRSLFTCKIGVFMFLLLLLVYAVRSWSRSIAWQNEYNLFVSALAVCPLNAKVHYNVAKAADANHETSFALAEYKEAIRLFPEYYQAMNNLANILKNQKQFAEAEYYLRAAVKHKKDFPAAWMNLGIVLAHTRRFDQSESAYRTALNYRRKYPDCYYNLGNLYLELNKTEEAINSWSQAIHQNPKHVLAWTNLMALMDNTGQIERALKIIPTVLTELPDAPSINFAIANMYGKLNRYGEAETHFKKAIKLLNIEVQAIHYANLGVLYHRWKKYSLAKEMYINALKIDPTLQTARKNLDSLQRSNK